MKSEDHEPTAESLCPLCGQPGRVWLEKRGFLLFECTKCEHRYFTPTDADNHVRTVYADGYFSGSEDGYVDYFGEESIQRASAKYYTQRLKKYLPTSARVLDVGAACGFFLAEYQSAGWQCLGIEPNAKMRATGLEKFKVRITDGSIDQIPSSERFELISAIQVISHLLDPKSFLAAAQTKLVSGGYLLIETWDRQSWAAKISGARWHELNPPSVLHWFSRSSLRKLICDQGFELIESGIPRKRIQLGRALRMIRHSWNNSGFSRCVTSPLLLVHDRFSVPYLLGDAFWMLFRKTN